MLLCQYTTTIAIVVRSGVLIDNSLDDDDDVLTEVENYGGMNRITASTDAGAASSIILSDRGWSILGR